MSIKINDHFTGRIFATCTEAGCQWETILETNSIEGVGQLHQWHNVHRVNNHGQTNEEVFGTVFKPAILTISDFNGHTPHMVTGQDFTESPKEEGDNKAMKALSDALRVKNMRIKQLESEAVERETLNKEMRQTIQELLETPDPMPLCKNLDGHNYVPLNHMFVFCTHCGHSIHYKTK